MKILLFAREDISFLREIGHLHKERAAVLFGIEKNFTRTSANEGNVCCP